MSYTPDKTVAYISIHALRVEGDIRKDFDLFELRAFLSTPSGWRATTMFTGNRCNSRHISIHALRVEGDLFRRRCRTKAPNFYPRPPGGGRLRFLGAFAT